MINLRHKFQLNNLSLKIKWIFSQSKPIIPFLICTIMIEIVLSLMGVYNAMLSKSLIDAAIDGSTSKVMKWLIVMGILFLVRILSTSLSSLVYTHASNKLTYSMQTRLYKHILSSKWMESNQFHSINLLTRLTSDVENINSTILKTIPSIVSLVVTLLASFSTLIYLAPSIALYALFIAPALVLIGRIFAPKLKKLYKASQEEDIQYRAFIQESLANLIIVKTFCMENFSTHKLKSIQQNKYDLSLKNTKLKLLSNTSINLCSACAYFIIFCWGALSIAKGKLSYGTFTAMIQLYNNIEYPLSDLASTFPSLISAIAATERLMEIETMQLEPSLEDDITTFTPSRITLNQLSFAYSEQCSTLHKANLTIYPGETIALVGVSGQGKTTLIRLLLSLLEPTNGEILIHTTSSEMSLNPSHRNLISYVPQGNTLFSGTILDNLLYGNSDATIEEINEALELACASFVYELKDQLHTKLSEQGSGLSEGQAQRLCLARALLRKRPILLLDEATSALDSDTELKVLESIQHLSYRPTCIIITHRPSALAICDRVLRLEDGQLNEITPSNMVVNS